MGEFKDGITEGDVEYCVLNNRFLVDKGITGEGIVIKNYAYRNKYGRQTWAKVLSSEFLALKKEGKPKQKTYLTKDQNEILSQIINKFVTQHLVDKEWSKIVNNQDTSSSSKKVNLQGELLSRVTKSVIEEDMWQILKEFKNPTINFKDFRSEVINKVKELKGEMF
jgi:hypothetical protein